MARRVKIDKDTLNAVMKAEMNPTAMQQMKELSAKKDETKVQFTVAKEQQTSGVKGFRIIGVMRDINNIKGEPLGYVLFNDAKQETGQYSAAQVKMILGMHSFVNAVLENDKVVITDGAETAMLQFDAYRNPIGTPTIYVLSRASETLSANGQKREQEVITFINHRLEIQKAPAEALITAKESGKIVIANMKVVPTVGGQKLEAKNITTIPTYEKEIRPEQVKTDDAEAFRKQQLKMKNHASFVQRIVDFIDNCVLIQNSATPHPKYTYIKIGGTSELHRGFNFVGVKGLTAVMEKEVIPVLMQKYPEADFTEALNEVHNNVLPDGTAVKVSTKAFIGKNISGDLNDPTRVLFYRYLYAFRLVKKLYKVVNTYAILRRYNSYPNASGAPYIIGCDWYVRTVMKELNSQNHLGQRHASYDEAQSVFSRFGNVRVATDIICGGISRVGRHTVIWPAPFKNVETAVRLLDAFPEQLAEYKPLLLHICSEAALIDSTIKGEEAFYRKNRITCMTAALVAACSIDIKSAAYGAVISAIENLLSCCTEMSNLPSVKKVLDYRFLNMLDKQYGYVEKSKNGNVDYIHTLLNDYATGAGLYVPYYTRLNKSSRTPYMHWEPIFASLKNQYIFKVFPQKFKCQQIRKMHKYGMLHTLDCALRRGVNVNVDYSISPNSKYYERIQNHKNERDNYGMQRYTILTSTLSRAAIAQYLGRPYRQRNDSWDAHMTRLVLYMNTYSPKKRNKTHELY